MIRADIYTHTFRPNVNATLFNGLQERAYKEWIIQSLAAKIFEAIAYIQIQNALATHLNSELNHTYYPLFEADLFIPASLRDGDCSPSIMRQYGPLRGSEPPKMEKQNEPALKTPQATEELPSSEISDDQGRAYIGKILQDLGCSVRPEKGNAYSHLGLNENAPLSAVKKQYYALARKLHPDKNPSQEAVRAMALINDSYGEIKGGG